ncbi:Signal transduction histidine kinase [Promicromonospora thailandica]|uniref:histidine kinase n=2 Tax=Promicromonospora thailandica TaxID=765201 RepID=A0A9X2JXF0_9MICO|nr:Signal transduction histidine kinase [Promicromonospora thailandica]
MTVDRPGAGPTTRPARRDPGFLTAPFASRTWREQAYLALVLLLAPFAFTYAVLTVSLAAGIAVTVVGLVVAGALVLGGRGWGAVHRGLARELLDVDVDAPAPYTRPRGFWRTVGSLIGDPAGWRALLFMIVTFPLTVLSFVVSITFLATGLGLITYGIWFRFLPEQTGADGELHRGAQLGSSYFLDTPPRILLGMLAGVVLLYCWPWITRTFTLLYRVLTAALLGPTQAGLRVAELERSRTGAVDDADARLRSIERDLHDGTQARLVAVAMQLGEAREHLAEGGDVAQAAELLETAHTSTKDALTELRELARGIHPPALDSGLAVALETLAARSALPVTVDVDPAVEAGGRLAPAQESIAYFTVAELVTNAAKHARATAAYVLVEALGETVRIRVRDDGRGGAHVVPPDGSGLRSGLAGLVERVRSVDGTFDLSSPVGGPTVVTVTLPTTLPGTGTGAADPA